MGDGHGIRAAWSGVHFYENFVFADVRTRYITQFKTRTGSNFYECFHFESLDEIDRNAIVNTR